MTGALPRGEHLAQFRIKVVGWTIALVVISTAIFSSSCSFAWGAEAYVFDARHSLMGNCSTSALDPVADPGLCPMPPGVPGFDHPPKALRNACGVVTDSYGNIYVGSSANGIPSTDGRVDVFSPDGVYLTEIKNEHQPCDVAVDSKGNLYAAEHDSGRRVLLFRPNVFPPTKGSTYAPPIVVHKTPETGTCKEAESVAIDPSNDRLFILQTCDGIVEYGSADENLLAENWTPIREDLGAGLLLSGGIDVYGKNHDLYAAGFDSGTVNGGEPEAQRIYVIDGTTGEKKCESDGSETPAGQFSFVFGNGAVAVDQSTGEFYVDDTKVNKVVDRFDAACTYVDQLPQPPPLQHPDFRAGLAVDEPCLGPAETSCNLAGYHSPRTGFVYVGSGEKEGGTHVYAFKPKVGSPPEIEAQTASGITGTEAQLEAKLNPHDLETAYYFEYINQADYEANGDGFGVGAPKTPVPPAEVGEGASFVPVAAQLTGLSPGTTYRFRLIAENEAGLSRGEGVPGGEGADAVFATYSLDTGGLPDRRGYELVTPPETGGYVPTLNELGFTPFGSAAAFPTGFATPGGNGLLFGIEGGSLPGLPGGGFHDTYEAHREADGQYGLWRSAFNGITGAEARFPTPNGFSADHTASFWAIQESGFADDGNYVRRSAGVLKAECSPEPASRLEVLGCGSLGVDPTASGGWISPGAGHVVFATRSISASQPQQLEPQAAPTGTGAIYDRTADGVTHVVSLKPGELPFGASENANYQGTSKDGTVVVFSVGEITYARIDNKETVEVAAGSVRFGGLSDHGDRVVYLRPNATQPTLEGTGIPQGEIFACDVRSAPCGGSGAQPPIQIGSGQKAVLVNVSDDGSDVYFSSPEVLDDEGRGKLGEDNLYQWDGSAIHLVAIVDPDDIVGREGQAAFGVGGLGLWVTNVVTPFPAPFAGPGSDPSRSTPDGGVLVFESRANLTDYDSHGHTEIYRYDSSAPPGSNLICLSCNPTTAAATSDSQLQSDSPPQFTSLPPVNALAEISNVTDNGRRVFFQSAEPLVLSDSDGKVDVYEWAAQNEGDCTSAAGCVRLISSPHSAADSYLYAMTTDGHDVFFETGDLLVARDHEPALSIYDARVDGGERPLPLPPEPCQGDACQTATTPPDDGIPASSSFEGPGNKGGTRAHCTKRGRKAPPARKGRCGGKHRKHHPKHHPHGHKGGAR